MAKARACAGVTARRAAGFGVRRSEDASPLGCFPPVQICPAGPRHAGDVVVACLLMAIAIEQHAERIKTGNYSPQLDAVAQEDRDRRSLALCSRNVS